MKRLCFCLMLLCVPRLANAADVWYVLNRADGCVSLQELYRDYPFTDALSQPGEIFASFHKQFADATMKSFLQYMREGHVADGTKPSAEESRAYQWFTESNAFYIESKGAGVEVALFDESLCRAMGGMPNAR